MKTKLQIITSVRSLASPWIVPACGSMIDGRAHHETSMDRQGTSRAHYGWTILSAMGEMSYYHRAKMGNSLTLPPGKVTGESQLI